MATLLTSYDLNGKKDSFASWISNLSPTDTFFVSVTGKEQVKNTLFQWQTDRLSAADKNNAQTEASNAVIGAIKKTTVKDNVTQILRKAVEVTDTADAVSTWGRDKELAYQMEKAGKEIKRDLEVILLQLDQAKTVGSAAQPQANKVSDDGSESDDAKVDGAARKTASFGKLVAEISTVAAGKNSNQSAQAATIKDEDTGAVVHMKTGTKDSMTEDQLFDITYNLYLAGSDANVIMYHPKHASFFSALMEVGAARGKLIDNMDTTLNKFVGSLIDPLGQQYKLVANRWMPEEAIYFFNPKDWTQMVLREPQRVKLAKKGSSERYMIEMEVGLRHRDPWASGILELKA
ncbi:MAG: SU10 major capsid protein [Plesiomonas sp.]